MLHHQQPDGSPTDYAYPPVTAAQYAVVTVLPDAILYPLTRVAAAVLLFLSIAAWSGKGAFRDRWIWPLLLSPPVINVIRLGQFNAAVGFAAITCAVMAERRSRGLLLGCALAVALCRPTNTLPAIAALVMAVAIRERRLLVPAVLIPALWIGCLGACRRKLNTDPSVATAVSSARGSVFRCR